jgi:hypothetical protein
MPPIIERRHLPSSTRNRNLVNPEQRVVTRKIKLIRSPSHHQASPVTESVVLPPVEGSVMSARHWGSDFRSIARPHCPNCHSEMMLFYILPSRGPLDLHIIEPGKCAYGESAEIDPLKSHAPWLLGELRPPN